jgi:glycosyltransferase involved in cell wall biosynthesis
MDILVIVKSIDGGTGTFLNSLSKLSCQNRIPNIKIRVAVLEKPSYRHNITQNCTFFHKKRFYPQTLSFRLRNIISFFKELTWLQKETVSGCPQIIMGIDMRCNFLSFLLKTVNFRNSKVIMSTHINLGSMTLNRFSLLFRILIKQIVRIIYSESDMLLVVSRGLSKQLKKEFDIDKKIINIYNGIKSGGVKSRVKTSKPVRILSVGRLNQQKNYPLLINAACILKQRGVNFKLTIVGDGQEKKHLAKYIKQKNLQEDVVLVGWKNKMDQIYSNNDIFVMSSDFEGFGYVLIEAMSYGLPVVSTNSPYGPREVLADGKYGILTPLGNSRVLARKIEELVYDKKKYKYYSEMSLQRTNDFSEDNMLTNYRKMFISILKQ